MGTKRKKAAEAPKPLPAQGQGGKKRTPQSAFDGAAGKDTAPRNCIQWIVFTSVVNYALLAG